MIWVGATDPQYSKAPPHFQLLSYFFFTERQTQQKCIWHLLHSLCLHPYSCLKGIKQRGQARYLGVNTAFGTPFCFKSNFLSWRHEFRRSWLARQAEFPHVSLLFEFHGSKQLLQKSLFLHLGHRTLFPLRFYR